MNNDFDPRFRDVLLDNMTVNIDVIEGHIFSHRYMRMRKRILRRYRHLPAASPVGVKHQQHRLRYAIIAVIVSTALIVGFTAWYTINGFIFKPYMTDTKIYFDNISDYPTELRSHFYLDADMSGYSQKIISDDSVMYSLSFSDGNGNNILIEQSTAEIYNGDSVINTENAVVAPTKVTIDGYDGFYYETYNHQHCLIIAFNDCIIFYSCNMNKETIENLVKSTKFK